jgi:Dolichyl-phosphate-mannose-protein mannosyltransferase
MSSTIRAFDHPPPHGRLPAADCSATAAVEAAAAPSPGGRVAAAAAFDWRRAASVLAVPAAMLVASFGFRALGLLQAVIDTDEGLYMVQAQAWLRGEWPLTSVWDMHPIGAPAMIALSLLAFGESVGAVRLLGILCVAATGWALFGLVRAVGGGRGLGIGAGLLYIAETTQLRGLATNTEILFAPFIAGAMAIATGAAARTLRTGAAPRWRELCVAGLLVGGALAIKQVVGLEGCLAFALLAFPALRRGSLPVGRFLGMAAAYALLCALPTALFALAYWLRGGLEVFLDTLFVAPFRYSLERLGPWEALQPISTALATLLWPVLLAGIGVANWWRRRPFPSDDAAGDGAPEALLARVGLLWFATGTLAIAGPGYFYPHYFLIWLPSLSILGALGAASLARMARPRLMPIAFAGILGVTAADAWRSDAAPRLDRGIGIWQPDPVQEVAEAVELRARPGEPVFVVNYHPVVYFLSRAGLPTRFVFPAHLSGDFDEVSDIDTDAELSRVLASRPRLVVVDRGWWPKLRPRAASTVTAALQADYVLAETVAEERGPVEIWQLR